MSRLLAILIDSFLLLAPISLFLSLFFGFNELKDNQNYEMGIAQIVIYGIVTILFWHKNGQTPGKRAIGAKVVDNNTLNNLSYLQGIIRFISYFFSLVTIIGILLPLFRKDKKALHDFTSCSTVIFTEKYNNIMINTDKYIKKKNG